MKKSVFSIVALTVLFIIAVTNFKVLKEIPQSEIDGIECNKAKFRAYKDARVAGYDHDSATTVSFSVYFSHMLLKIDQEIEKTNFNR